MPAEIDSAAQILATALIEEMAAALAARLGGSPTPAPASAPPAPAWTVTVRVGAPTACAVTLGISRDDAATLATLHGGGTAPPHDGAVVDALQSLTSHAVEALRDRSSTKGQLLLVETPCAVTSPPDGTASAFTIAVTADFAPTFGVWLGGGEPELAMAAAAARLVPPAPVEGPFDRVPQAGPPLPANLDVILDIDLPLAVRFGQTDMSLESLTRLGPGSLIDLGRSPDDPVDVLVNGRIVARGEVVVVGGSYGVRILEVVSTADRMRSLRG